jgi:hypothetical protein
MLPQAIRAGFWAICAVSLVAIALGGRERASHERRALETDAQILVDGRWWMQSDENPRGFDALTGRWFSLKFAGDDLLAHVRMAPWAEAGAGPQAAGRWSTVRNGPATADSMGLVRFRMTDGTVLDRIPLEVLVTGKPCWFADGTERVLFPGGDGALYQFDFDRTASGSSGPAQPKRLQWKNSAAGSNELLIYDVIWPTDPRWGRRLFATVDSKLPAAEGSGFAGPQIWWLEIDPASNTIEAAGRVTAPVPAESSGLPTGERAPSLAVLPGGAALIAFLSRIPGQGTWQVSVAALEFDAATGAPRVREGTRRSLQTHCGLVAPVFSPDGRSLYCLVNPQSPEARMERFVVPGDLLRPTANLVTHANASSVPDCTGDAEHLATN